MFNRDFLYFGAVLLITCASVFLSFGFTQYLIAFDDVYIKVKTIFGKTKKIKNLNDIKKVEIMKLTGGYQSGKYIVLNFSNDIIRTNNLHELSQEERVIFIFYSKESLENLEKNLHAN
jgi:hypothetical protein